MDVYKSDIKIINPYPIR